MVLGATFDIFNCNQLIKILKVSSNEISSRTNEQTLPIGSRRDLARLLGLTITNQDYKKPSLTGKK